MVSMRPTGRPEWTLPERQQELIPTPEDIVSLLFGVVVSIGLDEVD